MCYYFDTVPVQLPRHTSALFVVCIFHDPLLHLYVIIFIRLFHRNVPSKVMIHVARWRAHKSSRRLRVKTLKA